MIEQMSQMYPSALKYERANMCTFTELQSTETVLFIHVCSIPNATLILIASSLLRKNIHFSFYLLIHIVHVFIRL